jgi:Ca-activated chloride channel family protein
VKLQAPSDPGTYEIRYILGRGAKLLAKTTIEIKPVTARVQAPSSASMASDFDVSWQGPNAESDYICISHPGKSPGSRIHYTYTNRGNPVKLQAPSDPGTYEIRYILGRGAKLLAKTTIEIKPVTAQVTAPPSAKAGGTFEVNWEGPDSESDYISISHPGKSPGSRISYTYTHKGNPAVVKSPKEPGIYEVRYILGRGQKLLDKTTIEITP